jgi:hypothetical protein
MPERLVLCGGVKHAGGNSTLRLALSGRSRNITLRLEDLSKKFVRNVPSVLTDLIEIASYVYCAIRPRAGAVTCSGEWALIGGATFTSSSPLEIQIIGIARTSWNRFVLPSRFYPMTATHSILRRRSEPVPEICTGR